MAILTILQFPDPRLKLRAPPVETVDASIQTIAENMLATMYEARGVGLAATQVNIQNRIIVMDVSEDRSNPMVLINPAITAATGEIWWEEGCLSFPGVYAKVKRAKAVEVLYIDLSNAHQTLSAVGLLSICVQHEIDHLDGVTFYDRLSPLKQTMLREKLKKIREKRL